MGKSQKRPKQSHHTPVAEKSAERGDPSRGRIWVILISISMVLMELLSYVDKPEPHIVSWLLSGGLIIGLLSGVRWVRWLTVVWYGITSLFGFVASIQLRDPMLMVLTVYAVSVLLVFIKSRHIDAFFALPK